MNKTHNIETAIVVGAGIGGLAAACALAQKGVSVSVFERASILGEMGAGLQLSPNAMGALAFLGVGDAVQSAGFEPLHASIRDSHNGRYLVKLPLMRLCRPTFGGAYIHIHRVDLHDILLKRAQTLGVAIYLNCTVSKYERDGPDAAVILSDGARHKAQLIVGADGVRSVITDQMHTMVPPKFTGQVAWRGLVPAEHLPQDLIAPDATVWTGSGAHLVTYYLRGGRLVNFVAVQERDDWQDASWTQIGDISELRHAFAGWHPNVTQLLNATDTAHLWALFDRPELPHWSDGPVTLLGDACHPTLPFMAQGAAMALEDAVVLARSLQQAPLSQALAHYEALRKPRCSMLQAKARANGRLFHGADFMTRAKLTVAGALPGRLGLLPVHRVYNYDPRTV